MTIGNGKDMDVDTDMDTDMGTDTYSDTSMNMSSKPGLTQPKINLKICDLISFSQRITGAAV